jgi:hypothetical protein
LGLDLFQVEIDLYAPMKLFFFGRLGAEDADFSAESLLCGQRHPTTLSTSSIRSRIKVTRVLSRSKGLEKLDSALVKHVKMLPWLGR